MSEAILETSGGGADEGFVSAPNTSSEFIDKVKALAFDVPPAEAKPPVAAATEASKAPAPTTVTLETDKAKPATHAALDAEWKNKKAGDWQALKGERDQASKELEAAKSKMAELEARMNAPKDDSALLAQLETIKKERDTYDEQLKLLAVERHPKFDGYFKGKTATVLILAKTVLGADKAGAVEAALKMPAGNARNEALEELMADARPFQQTQLASLVTRMDELAVERESEIGKWRETHVQMEAEQKALGEQQVAAGRKVFEGALASAVKTLEVLQPREGDEAWNNETKQAVQLAQHLFMGQNSVEDLARAALWSAAAPRYRQLAGVLAKEVENLKGELAKYKEAKPTIASGTGAAANGEGAKPQGFAEQVLAQMRT